MSQAKFKYTFPITKAEKRADGLYITGYASGPEVDSEGERMAPEAIERFAAQINATDEDSRLVYRDAHAPDGVLRDLGDITKAWVTEQFHLGIEVKLDETNPAATYLWKKIDAGKQYGMSVSGHVIDYVNEFVESVGQTVLTYKNIVLDEISNTTRPAWYPSFGSVLTKSIKDADDASADGTHGDNRMGDKATDELLETVEDATKSDVADEAADDTQKADETAVDGDSTAKADDAPEDDTDKADEADDADVAKAGRRVSGATATRLIALQNEMTTILTDIGVLDAPAASGEGEADKSADKDEEATTEKSASTDATELAELRKSLEQATARIATLEAQPTATAPGAITDASKSTNELGDLLAKASPSERLRIAMAAHTSGR